MQLSRQRRASFGALFFEMLWVRWLRTTIYHLGYYKNSILFATFLGFGCGAARRRVDRLIPFFLPLVATTVFMAEMTDDIRESLRSLRANFYGPKQRPRRWPCLSWRRFHAP